jgi:hypothetical protein
MLGGVLLVTAVSCAVEEPVSSQGSELKWPTDPCWWDPSYCPPPPPPSCGALPAETTYECWDKATPLFPVSAPSHTALVVADAPDGSGRQIIYGIELGRFEEPPVDDRVAFVLSTPEDQQWVALAAIAQQTAVMMPPKDIGSAPSRRSVFVSRIALKLPPVPPLPGGDDTYEMTVQEIIDTAANTVYAGMQQGTICTSAS